MVETIGFVWGKLRGSVAKRGVWPTASIALRIVKGYLSGQMEFLRDRFWVPPSEYDRAHGIDTAGLIRAGRLGFSKGTRKGAVSYGPVDPNRFCVAMRHLPIKTDEYTFIDFGCGKGRALSLAAESGFRRVIGVEASAKLVAICERNVRAMLRRDTISVVCADFTQFELPPEPTVLFLFNPCKAAGVAQIARSIEDSLSLYPRPFYVVYVNPRHGRTFAESGRWSCIQQGGEAIFVAKAEVRVATAAGTA